MSSARRRWCDRTCTTRRCYPRARLARWQARIHLKTENLQRSGSYKVRGATYKLSRLTAEARARGVDAASAGNHAQRVAIAAALGVSCTIVMPPVASLAKSTATEGYGARVVLAGERDTGGDRSYLHSRR